VFVVQFRFMHASKQNEYIFIYSFAKKICTPPPFPAFKAPASEFRTNGFADLPATTRDALTGLLEQCNADWARFQANPLFMVK
jgi:hypothetical protein